MVQILDQTTLGSFVDDYIAHNLNFLREERSNYNFSSLVQGIADIEPNDLDVVTATNADEVCHSNQYIVDLMHRSGHFLKHEESIRSTYSQGKERGAVSFVLT